MTNKLQIISSILLTVFLFSSCESEESDEENESNNIDTFNCITGDFVNAGNGGFYNSLADCQNNCGGSNNSTTFECINGDCFDAGNNGSFGSLSECQSICGTTSNNPCDGITIVSWGGYTYQLVEIGSQCWFKENLRYEGGIQFVSADNWINNGMMPAYGILNDDPNNINLGLLYNWQAVDTGILCPAGWHIPSDIEWTELGDFLGALDPNGLPGGAMKSISGWSSPNTGATNSSGFSAISTGVRNPLGYDSSLGISSFIWSSTLTNGTNSAWFRVLSHDDANLKRSGGSISGGFSCRCIKD